MSRLVLRFVLLTVAAFFAAASTAAAVEVVYVANRSSDNLGMFTVNGGALTAQASSPFAVGHLPVDVVTSPDRHRVFVGNVADGTVGVYDVTTDGALTPVAGSPFRVRAGVPCASAPMAPASSSGPTPRSTSSTSPRVARSPRSPAPRSRRERWGRSSSST